MTVDECPCRYCKERKAECHSTCERYKEWEKLNAARRDKRSYEALLQNNIIGFNQESRKVRRRNGR